MCFQGFQSFQSFQSFQFYTKYREMWRTSDLFPHRLNQKLSSRRRQSERRHVDQPRQRNYSQVLQGGYPPEGPMAEVLRAEAETAGNSQRICEPRNPHRRPPTPGPGPQARRSLVTFHRWKVTRRRRDQKTKTTRVPRKKQRGTSSNQRKPHPPSARSE